MAQTKKTIKWLCEQYAEAHKLNAQHKIRTSFLTLYRNVARRLEACKVGKVAISKATADDIRAFDKSLSECADTTRTQYFNALKSAFAWAVVEGLTDNNPFLKIGRNERPRQDNRNRTIKYLSVEEIETLKRTLNREQPTERAFLFSYFTGLRLSDVQTLTKADIRTEKDGTKAICKRMQKTQEKVYIPLRAEALELMGEADEKGYFFVLSQHRVTIKRDLEKWAKRAGVETKLTFHMARHSFAVQCVRNGVGIEYISKFLGHRDISTTQIYAEIPEMTLKGVFDKIRF